MREASLLACLCAGQIAGGDKPRSYHDGPRAPALGLMHNAEASRELNTPKRRIKWGLMLELKKLMGDVAAHRLFKEYECDLILRAAQL
jgi:hypothetical protein